MVHCNPTQGMATGMENDGNIWENMGKYWGNHRKI